MPGHGLARGSVRRILVAPNRTWRRRIRRGVSGVGAVERLPHSGESQVDHVNTASGVAQIAASHGVGPAGHDSLNDKPEEEPLMELAMLKMPAGVVVPRTEALETVLRFKAALRQAGGRQRAGTAYR
jgi:hypothetical protein